MGPHLKSGTESFLRAMFFAGLMSAFVLGLFHIPTPSMEPALLGNADPAHLKECPFRAFHVDDEGDRVIASKYFSDIDRFDVVVFRFPLNVSLRFVKRIIGLPGESLMIRQGEVYRREGDEYHMIRKPMSLQDRLWIRITPEYPDAAALLKDWDIQGEHQIESKEIVLRPSGTTSARYHRSVYDDAHRNRAIVHDVRLQFDLDFTGNGEFIATLANWFGKFYLQILPNRTARLVANGMKQDLPEGLFKEQRTYRIELMHLDGELILRVDSRVVGSLAPAPSRNLVGYQVGIESRQLDARIRNLSLDRDLHFKIRHGDANIVDGVPFQVPVGEYFVLGDNASVSKDARSWSKVTITMRDGSDVVCERAEIERKYEDEVEMVVRADQYGNERVILKRDFVKESEPDPFRFIHGRYIVGKAQFIFWPPGRWFRSIQ